MWLMSETAVSARIDVSIGLAEIGRIHRGGDVQRAEIAGDVLAQVLVGQVVIVLAGFADLQDL